MAAPLAERQASILARIARLEVALCLAPARLEAAGKEALGGRWTPLGSEQADFCKRHAELRAVLDARQVQFELGAARQQPLLVSDQQERGRRRGFIVYRFARVPDNYYDQPLEFRCGPALLPAVPGAPS